MAVRMRTRLSLDDRLSTIRQGNTRDREHSDDIRRDPIKDQVARLRGRGPVRYGDETTDGMLEEIP